MKEWIYEATVRVRCSVSLSVRQLEDLLEEGKTEGLEDDTPFGKAPYISVKVLNCERMVRGGRL